MSVRQLTRKIEHMRKFVFFLVSLIVLGVSAQEKKFDPEKFDAEMEGYITQKAHLSQQEAAKLFPVFREMHKKQRGVYTRMRTLGKTKPADEEGCAEAIKVRDKCNLELKQLEQCYHQKMLQIVSASKLYDISKAESHYHRKMMKGWQHQGAKGKPKDKQR